MLWAAGVIASPAAKWLDAAHDRAGRIMVTPQLTVPMQPDIYAIGDTVAVAGEGGPVPGIAPAAKQMGAYVGKTIAARIGGGPPAAPFRYRHQGSLATIGRKAAVADLGWIRLSGFPAWVLWALAHVWFLIGWRNRFVVALNWMWSYVTFERGARLITAPPRRANPLRRSPSSQLEDARTGMMLQDKLDQTRAGWRASLDPADREVLLRHRRAPADAATGRARSGRGRPAARVHATR